jgi:hypothetical protein
MAIMITVFALKDSIIATAKAIREFFNSLS